MCLVLGRAERQRDGPSFRGAEASVAEQRQKQETQQVNTSCLSPLRHSHISHFFPRMTLGPFNLKPPNKIHCKHFPSEIP